VPILNNQSGPILAKLDQIGSYVSSIEKKGRCSRLYNLDARTEISTTIAGTQGSVLATFMMNSSLMVLILVTVSWLFVIFAENCAIQFASYYALLFIGGFRLIVLTGVSVIPIILAPYFSDDS
jgi:hypothetical protein